MLIIDHKRVKTKSWSKIKQTGESQGTKRSENIGKDELQNMVKKTTN